MENLKNKYICEYCGKEFFSVRPKRFCSRSCITNWQWSNGSLENRKIDPEVEKNRRKKISFTMKNWDSEYKLDVRTRMNTTRSNRPEEVKQAEVDKRYATMKQRGTSTHFSMAEEEFYNYLLGKYGKDSVRREYKSKEYPWHCDFYIDQIDLYIECNFHWTHGKHPFNPTNQEDLNQVKKWEQSDSIYDKTAIFVWTDMDVRKRTWAKENNLNFIEVWNDWTPGFEDNYVKTLHNKWKD